MSRVDVQASGKQCYRIKGARLSGEEQPQTYTYMDGALSTLAPSADDQTAIDIDASGCLLVPGFVDLYSRCREPGLTRKGTIASESMAALSAGFTQVLCSPDTIPIVDNVATVELITHRSDQVQGGATVIPMAAMTLGLQGQQLSELATLQAAGCPVASQADQPIESTTVLYSTMQYASSFRMPLLLTARDAQLGIDGCAHNGATATQLGLPTIPVAAETVALSRLIELCRDTHCQLHVSRISSKRAVQQIDEAKQAGLPITCDVGIHHLFFTDKLLAGYDAAFHSAVPFRSDTDRQALRSGLASGVIDAICSDHSPHDIDAGLAPFPVTEPGLSAYDWFIPLMLQVPEATGLSLEQVFEKLHKAPRKILNLDTENTGDTDAMTSFFLLDPDAQLETFSDYALSAGLSAGSNSPLAKHEAATLDLSPLHGRVKAAFHGGWYCNFEQHK